MLTMALPACLPESVRHCVCSGSARRTQAASCTANGGMRQASACANPFSSGSAPQRNAVAGIGVGRSLRRCSGGRSARRRQGDAVVTCSLRDTAVGLGIFFTPSILATIYALYRGKGNLGNGFSRLLTEVRRQVVSARGSHEV